MEVWQAVWDAVWPVVSQRDWWGPAAAITFLMGFSLSMPGALRGRVGFGIAAIFGAASATALTWDPFRLGPLRALTLVPVWLGLFGAIVLLVDTHAAASRWWRVRSGHPTPWDASVMVRKVMERQQATQVLDALSRSPGAPTFTLGKAAWPGETLMVTPDTVVRWLRSGEPPLRLWQMLCVGKDDAAIRAYLDGFEQVDWAAVETLAALRAAAY